MRACFGGVVLVIGLTALWSNEAAAQQTDPVAFWSATIGIGVPMLAVDTVLVVEAIDKAVNRGHGLYLAGAIFEVVWGAVHVVGAGVAAGVSTFAYDPPPLALTFGVPLALVGGYFLAHGIWSLVPGSSGGYQTLFVAVAPSSDGAHAVVSGSF